MKRHLRQAAVLASILMAAGCAWLDYHDTKVYSASRYLPVDAAAQNFGYQRLMINCRLREAVDALVQTRGTPDYIFEYNKAAQNGIRLYYLQENRVFDFLERGTNPNSAALLEERELTSYEKAEIKELQGRQPL